MLVPIRILGLNLQQQNHVIAYNDREIIQVNWVLCLVDYCREEFGNFKIFLTSKKCRKKITNFRVKFVNFPGEKGRF